MPRQQGIEGDAMKGDAASSLKTFDREGRAFVRALFHSLLRHRSPDEDSARVVPRHMNCHTEAQIWLPPQGSFGPLLPADSNSRLKLDDHRNPPEARSFAQSQQVPSEPLMRVVESSALARAAWRREAAGDYQRDGNASSGPRKQHRGAARCKARAVPSSLLT